MSVDLPESYSRELLQHHGNILTRIRFPQLSSSLVGYVSNFGNLVYGNLKKNYYKPRLNQEINDFLYLLTSIDKINEQFQPVWFKLHLLRCMIKDSWRWPCLITEIGPGLSWNSGQGRMCVTGIGYNNPWNLLNCLMLQNKSTPVDYYLDNVTLITNDQLLHYKLGIEYSSNDLLADIGLSFIFENNRLILDGLYDGNSTHEYDAGKNLLENFLDWKNHYGTRPKIHVYTPWPEMVNNYRDLWTVEIHTLDRCNTTLKFREIELYTYNNSPRHGTDHVLFVYSPDPIDIGLLFPWMDLTYSAFLDMDRGFALLRPASEYLTTEIKINREYQ